MFHSHTAFATAARSASFSGRSPGKSVVAYLAIRTGFRKYFVERFPFTVFYMDLPDCIFAP